MDSLSMRSQIQKDASTIAFQSGGSENLRALAKSSIKQLTSEERKHLLEILLNSNTPVNEKLETSISSKFSKLLHGGLEEYKSVNRDAGKNILQRVGANISRFTQNVLGIRESSEEALNHTKLLMQMQSIKDSEAGNTLQGTFICREWESLRNNLLGLPAGQKRLLDGKNEYKLFGLKPDATRGELDKAVYKYLSENRDDGEKTKVGRESYERLILLREAQTILGTHSPMTLKQAHELEKNYTGDAEQAQYQKAMKSLTILANDKTVFPNFFNTAARKLDEMNRAV